MRSIINQNPKNNIIANIKEIILLSEILNYIKRRSLKMLVRGEEDLYSYSAFGEGPSRRRQCVLGYRALT